jgi:cation transport ATPase
VLNLACSVKRYSEHLLAQAILKKGEKAGSQYLDVAVSTKSAQTSNRKIKLGH